jgi:hypothetical protein
VSTHPGCRAKVIGRLPADLGRKFPGKRASTVTNPNYTRAMAAALRASEGSGPIEGGILFHREIQGGKLFHFQPPNPKKPLERRLRVEQHPSLNPAGGWAG